MLSCWFSGLFERLPADSLGVKLSERSLRMILFGSRALVTVGLILNCDSLVTVGFDSEC